MTRWVVMLALSVLATGCCRGKSTGSTSDTSGPGIGSPVGTFKAGDSVDVEWNGSWWQGRVLSVNGNPTSEASPTVQPLDNVVVTGVVLSLVGNNGRV